MNARGTGWIVGVAAVFAAAALLGTGIMMASAMGGTMDGHMGRRGGGDQTPVAFSTRDVAIEISDFDYSPREAAVLVGARVTFTNSEGTPHSATGRGGGWDTGILKEDESSVVTFDSPGTYDYYCTLHPGQEGKITVN